MENKIQVKERGKLIAIWLTLLLIFSFVLAFLMLFIKYSIVDYLPSAPSWIAYVYSLLFVLSGISVIFLFKWKIWAFWSFTTVSIIGASLNLFFGAGFFNSLLSLASVAVLYFVLKTKWDLFE